MSWRTSLKSVWKYCDLHFSSVVKRLVALASFAAESYRSYSARSFHSGFLSSAAKPYARAKTTPTAASPTLDSTSFLHAGVARGRPDPAPPVSANFRSIPDAGATPQLSPVTTHPAYDDPVDNDPVSN